MTKVICTSSADDFEEEAEVCFSVEDDELRLLILIIILLQVTGSDYRISNAAQTPENIINSIRSCLTDRDDVI